MRELAPVLAQRFPTRAPPPLPPQRVDDPTTEAEWRAFIGTRVLVEPQGRAGSKDRIRPVPARLVGVGMGRAEIALPHHKGTERVPLRCLKRWMKGEHDDALHQEAHAKRHPTPIAFPVPALTHTPTPSKAPVMDASAMHGTQSIPVAKRESARSIAKGKVLIRDALSGKYWKGGKPGVSFDVRLHGFVTDVAGARITDPDTAQAALYIARKRGVNGFRHELLTVEQASVHYGERHPVLDKPLEWSALTNPERPKFIHEHEHTPELMPREDADHEPEPMPEPEAKRVPALPAPALPAPSLAPVAPAPATFSHLDGMRSSLIALEAAIREKAAADSLAASQGIEVRKCEELFRVAKMRMELGL